MSGTPGIGWEAAYREGWAAFVRGEPEKAIPYTWGTPEAGGWYNGWSIAQMKSKDTDLQKEFREAARGVPTHQVAWLLNKHLPGVNMTGSTKAQMAEAWADEEEHLGSRWRDRDTCLSTLRKLRDELQRYKAIKKKIATKKPPPSKKAPPPKKVKQPEQLDLYLFGHEFDIDGSRCRVKVEAATYVGEKIATYCWKLTEWRGERWLDAGQVQFRADASPEQIAEALIVPVSAIPRVPEMPPRELSITHQFPSGAWVSLPTSGAEIFTINHGGRSYQVELRPGGELVIRSNTIQFMQLAARPVAANALKIKGEPR